MRKGFPLLALAALLAGAAPAGAVEAPPAVSSSNPPKPAPASSLAATQRELTEIERRMESARQALAAREDEERTLLGEMERLDRAIAGGKEGVARLRAEEAANARRVVEAARRLEQLRVEEEAQRRQLEGRVVALYKYGQVGRAGLTLAGSHPEQRERGVRFLTAAARSDSDLLRKARLLYSAQQRAADELSERQEGLAKTREALSTELAELSGRKEDKARLLAGIRDEKESQAALLSEMESAAARLNRMIEEMRREGQGESGFAALRGLLPLPVAGPVVEEFGRHKNPRFGTYTISRGVTIKAAEGTPAQAVCAGKTLFADWFRGYGRIAILDHGGGWYTLYGHLATVAVAVGDEVPAGAEVGRVGETGSLSGPALYFEIRRHGKPEDPKPWFARQPTSSGGSGRK